jgi:sRNA-binding regulator protein Hfq
MGYLAGLNEYLDEWYDISVFDHAVASKKPFEFHLHGHRLARATVLENLTYDLKVAIEDQGEEEIPKIQIKLLYAADSADSIRPLIKIDEEVKLLEMEPILSPHHRHFVKNKSLFPLMKEQQVVFFTLLEGELLRGIITGFSRYEVTINLKGGLPATILRHSIYDLRNKTGRCFLKSFQDRHRDWEKSTIYVS